MTRCANCGDQVNPRTARIYVRPDGSEALTLCRGCRAKYDRSRQYSPSSPPTQSRYDLSDRGRDPA